MPKAKAATSKVKTTKKAASAPSVKQTSVKRTTVKQSAGDTPFFTYRVTQQTLYWLILGALAILFAMWIYSLDARIQKLYDDIDTSTYSTQEIMPVKKAATPTPDPAPAATAE